MSRGHGRVQRLILERVGQTHEHEVSGSQVASPCWIFLRDLATELGGTRAARESVRRATRRLEAEGVVIVRDRGPRGDGDVVWTDQQPRWTWRTRRGKRERYYWGGSNHFRVAVHRPLSDEEKAAEAKHDEESEAWVREMMEKLGVKK